VKHKETEKRLPPKPLSNTQEKLRQAKKRGQSAVKKNASSKKRKRRNLKKVGGSTEARGKEEGIITKRFNPDRKRPGEKNPDKTIPGVDSKGHRRRGERGSKSSSRTPRLDGPDFSSRIFKWSVDRCKRPELKNNALICYLTFSPRLSASNLVPSGAFFEKKKIKYQGSLRFRVGARGANRWTSEKGKENGH